MTIFLQPLSSTAARVNIQDRALVHVTDSVFGPVRGSVQKLIQTQTLF